MVEVKWMPVIIGICIAIVVGRIFDMVIPGYGSFLAYIVATLYVGYAVAGGYMNGAIHGALVGIVSGLIGGIIAIILLSALAGAEGAGIGILGVIIGIIIAAIIGGVCGAVGALIKGEAPAVEA